jgi:outer membrane lipoprotein-sorting protein
MTVYRSQFLLVILGLVSGSSFAQKPDKKNRDRNFDEFRKLLERAQDIRFSGTRLVTVVRAGKPESHTEYVTRDKGNLRIEFAKDSKYTGQIIIETSGFRKHFFPDRNEIKESPVSARRQFDLGRLMRGPGRMGQSRTQISEGGVVAGFKTQKMTISDPQGNRLIEVFADPKTGLLLKRVVFDPTGSVAGSFEFQQVKLNPSINQTAFVLNRKGAKVVRPIDDLRRQASEMGVPAFSFSDSSGLQLEAVNTRSMKDSKTLTQMFSMSDNRYTLFMTKSDIPEEQIKRFQRGELRTFVWQLNGVTLVLMGMDSEDALKKMSRKVVDRSN